MDEFVSLARDETHHTFHEASKVHNQSKNRYKNVYPYDTTRVRLSQIHNLSGSDYINASHIDGYVQEGAFIASQAPLERTFEDFWRMVWEKDSRTIVMLSKEEEGGKVRSSRRVIRICLEIRMFSHTAKVISAVEISMAASPI